MIKSDVYRLSRLELAYVTGEEYLRTYWWWALTVPVFGIAAMILGQGAVKVIGLMAFLWPFSIPARSILATTKSSRLFTGSCHVEASEEEVAFIGEYKDGKRLRFKVESSRLKSVIRRRGIIVIRTRLPGFLPVKESAFGDEEQVEAFLSLVEGGIARWQNAEAVVNE